VRRLARVFDIRDALLLVGGGLVVYGLALVYVPAAYIVPGLGCIALAVWRVR
jgi:hypothetical protein